MLNSRSSKRAKRFDPLRKRNVLHIVTAISWRGGEQQVAYLLEELKDDIRQTVLCMKGSAMQQYCEKNGIDVFPFPKRIKLDFSFAAQIKKLCVKLEIDVCHLHDAHAHTMAVLAAMIYRNKTDLVLSRRVDFPIKKSYFSKLKYNHPSIKKILCVSKTIEKIIRPDIVEKDKLTTVYSGINIDKFKHRSHKLRKELKISDSTVLIGNTSALADHKDYFTFIDVAEKLVQQSEVLKFVVIGDGPLKDEIKAYLKNKKISGHIYFTGFRKDLPEVLADLDLFLITSKTEGLGTSILDAFACGVPVVGTAAGGMPELIEHEITGLLCPVKDVECLTKSVSRLIDSKELSKMLVQNAKEKVKLFSKAATAKQTLAIYQSIWS